jgi:capsular polysaccharide export protein
MNNAASDRRFLLLQGPHGPFFSRLGMALRTTGAQTWRVSFNAGDAFFWSDKATLLPFEKTQKEWPEIFAQICKDKGITDLVLYGDTRHIHAIALDHARKIGIRTHIFEEGYLRPYWITYERSGTNGRSRLVHLSLAEMKQTLKQSDVDLREIPSHWGDMRQHVFYGALYHWFVMFANRHYPSFKPHRKLTVAEEFRLYLRRFLLMPFQTVERWSATRRIKRGGFPYHLALLQLEHDTNFQIHSPLSSMSEFVEFTIGGFAKGAPPHHHLVFKAHPLENGSIPLRSLIKTRAKDAGVLDRVHYVRGGKLAHLLDDAHSAITINSTAGQQVLWRGLPLKALGTSVYSKPEFVSRQPISDFFANPTQPNHKDYIAYRTFLLETSQVPGSYYSAKGRNTLLRHIVDILLAPKDPYDALTAPNAATSQQLRLVTSEPQDTGLVIMPRFK